MARFSCATWRGPIPNFTQGGLAPRLVVLHVMEGTLDGTDSWFRNPQAQASAHFGVGRDGRAFQWVDTADMAWAQAAGNPYCISIECEGHTGDALTDVQLAAVRDIVAEAHAVHGVPLVVCDDVNGAGLGWHGMGGQAWGGHFDCPGQPVIDQRAQILAAPAAGAAPTEGDPDVILVRSDSGAIAVCNGASKLWVPDRESLASLEAKLGAPVQLTDAMYASIPCAVPGAPAARG